MVIVTFDKLYDIYNTLTDAKEKVGELTNDYEQVVDATKGDPKMKMLTTKIIPTFFKHFPDLQAQAIEAIIDMCEVDDTKIRVAAMRTLPILCKANKAFIGKVADILAQLLQLEDQVEYNVVCSCIMQLLEDDVATVIKCIFLQVHESENIAREKCIKFFTTKIKTVDKALITTEVEDLIILQIKKVLQDASGEEFSQLMSYLVTTKFAQNFKGMQELVDIAADQAELDQDFDPVDEECNNADRFITCTKFVLPFFSVNINSSRFVKYITDQILPQWKLVRTECKHHILQQLAELSIYCGPLENASLHVVQIFDRIKQELPEPPEQEEASKTSDTMPTYDFTACESLLFAFHALARQCKDFLTHDAAVLKEFRGRLMYCARAVQGCLKVIQNVDKDKILTPDERKKKEIAPLMLNNINALIRDLFYQPPVYKCKVQLSFKKTKQPVAKVPTPTKVESPPSTAKRHQPITFSSNGSSATKQVRSNKSGENMQLYAPPSGKFSNNLNNFDDRKLGGGNRNRGRGRGGRGRGRGGWRNN